MNEAIQINIDHIIKTRNPKVYRWIPGFLIRWFERFIHQDEMNHVLQQGHHLSGVDFAKFVLDYMQVTVSFEGLENIPTNGGCIVASNHPMGGLEGMALICGVHHRRPDIRFLANDFLMNIAPLKDIFIPVNKLGSTAKTYLSNISDEYSSGKAILIFPAGLVSRKIDGKLQDLPWQKSYIKQSIKHQLPIVPVFVNGKNSNRFYKLAQWRKRLGIKFNFEMLTLPDEMYQQKGKSMSLKFGKPIDPALFSSVQPQDVTNNIREFVYQLEKNPNATFIL